MTKYKNISSLFALLSVLYGNAAFSIDPLNDESQNIIAINEQDNQKDFSEEYFDILLPNNRTQEQESVIQNYEEAIENNNLPLIHHQVDQNAEDNELLNALMDQAKIYVKYKEGTPEEKAEAQTKMLQILEQMITDFQNTYLNERTNPDFLNQLDEIRVIFKNGLFKDDPILKQDWNLYLALLNRFEDLKQNLHTISLQDIEKFGFVLTLLSIKNQWYTNKPFFIPSKKEGNIVIPSKMESDAVEAFSAPINVNSFFIQDIKEFLKAYNPLLSSGQVEKGGNEERGAYKAMNLTNHENSGTPLEIAPFYSETGAIGLATMSYAAAHSLMPVGFFLAPPETVHGGYYARYPIGFIRHDYRHVRLWADSMRGDVVYKSGLLKTIYNRIQNEANTEIRKKDLIILFLITHEFTFSITDPFLIEGKAENIGKGHNFESYLKANPHNFFQSRPKIGAFMFNKPALDEKIDRDKNEYILDLQDVANLIREIDPDFPLEPNSSNTWADLKNFNKAVREKMIELFKEFKTRHPEYKKSTHGYSSNNSLEIKKNLEFDLDQAIEANKKSRENIKNTLKEKRFIYEKNTTDRLQAELNAATNKLKDIQDKITGKKMGKEMQ